MQLRKVVWVARNEVGGTDSGATYRETGTATGMMIYLGLTTRSIIYI